MFKTPWRAILRVSAFGNVRILFPRLCTLPKPRQGKSIRAGAMDFFSIGTNDLVQYTLAADRTKEEVGDLCNPDDSAVLRLIDRMVQAGQKHGVGVNV
ncbi:MAG: hypothetical protein HYS12_24635 [Planctomycetes bacterium]|nr:hypothetical protein [Planctomycetota bacterium]